MHLRPATTDDIAGIGAMVRAAQVHDGIDQALMDDEVAQEFASPWLDLDADTRVAVDGADGDAGSIVGWAYVWNPPSEQRLERAELIGEVHPGHRKQGVGSALLAWSLDRAKQRLSQRTHGLPTHIRTHAYDWLEDRHRLYRRHGFEPVRWHDELLRPLTDLPPVPTPPCIVLRPWPAADDAAAADRLRHVRNEAFADHWGSMVVGPDLWRDFVHGHGSRTDLSVVAIDEATGEIVGACMNHAYPEDQELTGRKDAWIANVFTLRPARGRGVASAMIAWSLHAFAQAGFDHAALDVDSENPTGAARLYRNLGFQPHRRSVTFEFAQ